MQLYFLKGKLRKRIPGLRAGSRKFNQSSDDPTIVQSMKNKSILVIEAEMSTEAKDSLKWWQIRARGSLGRGMW